MTPGHTTLLTGQELKSVLNGRKESIHEEYKYLHLMQKILDEGVEKGDRTGIGTKSIFGAQLKFDISKSFPLMTTKKVFLRGIIEELLWFIRGETDSKLLEAKGVNIWRGNTSREFLDKRGLEYPEGEIGACYGFLWRHWGADYGGYKSTLKTDPSSVSYHLKKMEFSKGIDQLAKVIETIKTNPNDRRMIVSTWSVSDLDKMALNPCHILQQYYVENGKLHLMWFQRANDFFLGSVFNIASYAVLTMLIAKITGLEPGSITYAMGDSHLYLNHIDQAKEQLSRTPYPFPKLLIKKDIKTLEDIENMVYEDFELVDYQCHPAIKAPMAV